MKILLIANGFRGLYKQVEEELRRQGHEVKTFVIPFIFMPDDPCGKVRHFKFRNKYRLFYNKYICNVHEKYWREQIEKTDYLSATYDMLFVLGCAFVSKLFVEHLRRYNANIKTVCYAWDSLSLYDNKPMFDYFDCVYSFDIRDCRENSKIRFLPNYWIADEQRQNEQPSDYKYDFFFIGANTAGRYLKMKKLAAYFRQHNYKYCIHVVSVGQFMTTFYEKFIYVMMSLFFKKNDEEYWSYIAYYKDKDDEYNIKSSQPIYGEEYKKLEDVSRCIIDIPLPQQTGMPPRFIWALAHGKKILTTSPWALEHSFVSPEQVAVVDIDNIHIPADFLNTPLRTKPDLSFCRLDNWVDTIINMKETKQG